MTAVSYTHLLTGQPATDYIRAAIAQDRHVITTNKGPVGLFYPELSAMAAERGVHLGVEGTVMGGTPVPVSYTHLDVYKRQRR